MHMSRLRNKFLRERTKESKILENCGESFILGKLIQKNLLYFSYQ